MPTISALQLDSCEHSSGAYRVVLPEGWWTNPAFEDDELGNIAACRFFAPTEFDVTTGNRDTPVPEGAAVFMEFLDGGCVGYINAMTSREPIVAGYPTVVSELAFGKEGTGPPFTYEYVVTLTPDTDCERDGRYIHAFTRRDFVGDYEDNTAVLDRMMQTIRSLRSRPSLVASKLTVAQPAVGGLERSASRRRQGYDRP